MTNPEAMFRRGTPADVRSAWDVGMAAMGDYSVRQGIPWNVDPDAFYDGTASYLDHLAEHAAEWWVAEDGSDGSMVGYARSVERGGLIELSERGIGRAAHTGSARPWPVPPRRVACACAASGPGLSRRCRPTAAG
jgi:hypothetical protein